MQGVPCRPCDGDERSGRAPGDRGGQPGGDARLAGRPAAAHCILRRTGAPRCAALIGRVISTPMSPAAARSAPPPCRRARASCAAASATASAGLQQGRGGSRPCMRGAGAARVRRRTPERPRMPERSRMPERPRMPERWRTLDPWRMLEGPRMPERSRIPQWPRMPGRPAAPAPLVASGAGDGAGGGEELHPGGRRAPGPDLPALLGQSHQAGGALAGGARRRRCRRPALSLEGYADPVEMAWVCLDHA